MSFREDIPDADWHAFVKRQRETNLKGMAKSASVVSVYPASGELDLEYAIQVGACILLDKPLLVMVVPGQEIPPKLRAVADEVVEVDLDQLDTAGPEIRARIKAFTERHGVSDG